MSNSLGQPVLFKGKVVNGATNGATVDSRR
jgi:hypothetical protein